MNQEMSRTIREYFKTQPVEKAWFFGSFSRGEERADCDVDILITLIPGTRMGLKFFAMNIELEKLLNRPWVREPSPDPGIGNETGRFYLGFQEDFESCDQNDLGLQESGQEAGAAGTDCRNLHFHRPRCSPFFWNPAPLMQNYMIKSVKMTKKSILPDQFSWKVRTFVHAFRKGCRSFCCSISQPNCDLERDLMGKSKYTLKLRTIAQTSTIVYLGLSQAWLRVWTGPALSLCPY